jgi:hypothetical protein
MVRYGRGRVRLLRKHPETFSWPGYVPAGFVAGLALGLPMARSWPLMAWVYAGILGLYAAVVLLYGVGLSLRHRRWELLPYLPLVFGTIHLAAGVGIWWEVIGGAPRGPQGKERISHGCQPEFGYCTGPGTDREQGDAQRPDD